MHMTENEYGMATGPQMRQHYAESPCSQLGIEPQTGTNSQASGNGLEKVSLVKPNATVTDADTVPALTLAMSESCRLYRAASTTQAVIVLAQEVGVYLEYQRRRTVEWNREDTQHSQTRVPRM